ncbi:RsmB/NOP family class I SAM-dependent RNA methyltransferase [Cerasicoccus frondis]|uniref:RsmB/NOP family class I SAM-dependent RNA methyltransferase n=1 Tax=Cerasicoccus frondis TaxID=490090 RepID=UPI002852976F|nr:RsmB/NOP family class I SAM-dependent RNA methyltransferase [Cerasicoccus frondis]
MRHSSNSPNRSTHADQSKKKHGASTDGWALAVALCEKFASRPNQKADALLNNLSDAISSEERRRCQRLFYGAMRHNRLINHLLDTLIERPPRPQLHAMLAVALAEWLENIAAGAHIPQVKKSKKDDDGLPTAIFFPGLENDDTLPKIADFTVERVKRALTPGEAKFANAILRRCRGLMEEVANSGSLGLRSSHPDWLVRRWIAEHGSEWTEKTLLYNQIAAEPALRWRAKSPAPADWLPMTLDALVECTESDAPLFSLSVPPLFYHLGENARWPEALEKLNSGQAYAQDPATWLAPALADVQPGEAVFDLCAAPGGKASYLIEALGDDPAGALVLLDQPGKRIAQLDENLRKWSGEGIDGPELHLVALDLFEALPDEFGAYNCVLLDAPCSNTGVIRRRPDVKTRLAPRDLAQCAELQLKLLTKAAEFVADGGRLIYSTCSLEPEENSGVVEAFLEANTEWKVTATAQSTPGDTAFDGATVFRLERE